MSRCEVWLLTMSLCKAVSGSCGWGCEREGLLVEHRLEFGKGAAGGSEPAFGGPGWEVILCVGLLVGTRLERSQGCGVAHARVCQSLLNKGRWMGTRRSLVVVMRVDIQGQQASLR